MTGRVLDGYPDPQPGPGESRWTAFFRLDGGKGEPWYEEVDVNASTAAEARKLATEYAERDLVAGAKLAKVERRFGLYW